MNWFLLTIHFSTGQLFNHMKHGGWWGSYKHPGWRYYRRRWDMISPLSLIVCFSKKNRQAKKLACVLIWGSALLFSPLFHLFRVSGGRSGRRRHEVFGKKNNVASKTYLEWGCWYCRNVGLQTKVGDPNHPRYFILPVWAKTMHITFFLNLCMGNWLWTISFYSNS